MNLFLCGDVMTGRGIDQILPHPGDPTIHEDYLKDARDYVTLAEQQSGPVARDGGFDAPWGDALAELDRRRPDARIANLETSITARGSPWPKGINYRMHPDNVRCLTAAKLDACTLANNHVLDWGEDGLLDTLDALEAAGIAICGAGPDEESALRPAVVTVPGGRVLVFGVATRDSGVPRSWAAGPEKPGIALLRELSDEVADLLLARITRDRRPGDVVVVSVHWGDNWGHEIAPEQVRFAHRLVDGGVDVVHGHSSHHPRAFEVYRGRLVLYGCGDVLNDYEGITGHEKWRPELALLWFARLDASGSLEALEMTPMRSDRLRLRRVTEEADVRWLADTLTRAASSFGTRVEAGADAVLRLST